MLDEDGNPIPKSERKPKKKCAVLFGYCGTGYNGLQVQNDEKVKTIEKDLYKAMSAAGAISLENSIDQKKSGFQRAARTDKGVHAAGNVISLKLIIEDPQILTKINDNLPPQIRVWNIQRTTKGFDCRKMCSSRVYEYLLPTYSLLPPKPASVLSNLIKEKKALYPTLFVDDQNEGDQWWEKVLQQIQDSSSKSKQLETELRRSYRVSKHRLDNFRLVMKKYEGTNNFHNFTVGKDFKDTSSKRYIMSCKVDEPFVINGTEWVSIKIHGQSFMLHQIRKMIAMATLLIRCDLPHNLIDDFFNQTKINIPKAPALGLLLENPVYDSFNNKIRGGDQGYDIISFEKYATQMNDFKMKFIYDKIYQEEYDENVFNTFFSFIDSFNISPQDEDGGKNKVVIFDFITNYIDKHGKELVQP